eukprot:1001665-Karenia_brevis.AAC.1
MQSHAHYHSTIPAPIPSGSVADVCLASSLQDLDWEVPVACVHHDVQNAYKWSVIQTLPDTKESLKKLFITVEAVRNSF